MKNITLEKIYTKITNLDILIYLVWFLLLFLLVVSLKLQYFTILFPAIFANIGIIIYLVFKKRGKLLPEWGTDHAELENNNGIQIDRTIAVMSSILFFIIFSISLLSILQESYTISILYYLCISVCAATLIFEIFSFKSVFSRYVILFQAFLLSLNIVFTNHLIFPEWISQPDGGFHLRFVMDILNTGYITTFKEYGLVNFFAFHHIFAAEVTLLTGNNPLPIYLLLGSFLIAMGVLFVFLIGKRFVNFQFGLIAAVLFTCLDFYLMIGEHPEHVAYSFGFALICVTMILFTYGSRKPAFYLLFVLSAVAIIMTHHLTAAIVFVTVCSLVLIDIFHLIQTRERSFSSIFVAVTFGIIGIVTLYIISDYNPVEYLKYFFEPLLIKIKSLLAFFFTAPIHVTSIPVPQFRLPQFRLPQFRLPQFRLPQFRLPQFRLPQFRLPQFRLPQFRLPQFRLPQFRLHLCQSPILPMVSQQHMINYQSSHYLKTHLAHHCWC